MSSVAPPFAPLTPVRSMADVRRLESVPLEKAIPAQSTYELVRNAAHAFGDRTALSFLQTVDAEPMRWSFADLLSGVHQTANLLHRLGVRAYDAVAILLPGCLEYQLALWGGEAAGIVLPLNPLLSDDKLVSLMNATRTRVLIAWGADEESEIWSKAMRIHPRVSTLSQVLRVAPPGEEVAPKSLPAVVGDFNALRQEERTDQLDSGRVIRREDIAAYFHTGGTTGAPKLAKHSHGAQVFTAWASVQMQGTRSDDFMINGFPLFHVAGVLPASLAAIAVGMESLIPTPSLYRNRDVIANYWRLVARYRPTYASAVPTVIAALANIPIGDNDISSLKSCRTGAAPLPPELAARFEALTGLRANGSYGMTETAGLSAILPPGQSGPAECVGYRMPYSELRIVALDEHGNPTEQALPAGEKGMVQYKGPNLFSGFVDAQDNVNVLVNGWLATGDLGWIDEQERLHLTGRSKDLIIRGGHNIDPKVIEDALGSHPAVLLCAAVGAPDAYAGEIPFAFATLRPGSSISEDELAAFTASRVDETPARPKRVVVLEQLPMTNVGKVYKPELRALAAAAVVRDAIAPVCRQFGVADLTKVEVASDHLVSVQVGIEPGVAIERSLRQAIEGIPFQTRVVFTDPKGTR